MGAFGKMLAFEGVGALALFVVGRLAPEAKARATAAAKAKIAEVSPEFAQQLEQAEQLESQALGQLTGGQ